jgi:excisionase family DNA binding protein
MSLEHSPARDGASPVGAHIAVVDPLEGRLAVKPKLACKALSVGLTRIYELLKTGELESYSDGRSRKITTASIRAYVARRIMTAHAQRSTSDRGEEPA